MPPKIKEIKKTMYALEKKQKENMIRKKFWELLLNTIMNKFGRTF